ncbi:hypothetical protein AZOA_47950 [Azoarcus sp. Aa7]|nr:hypothetical protein [Azoarcus sp. Aa7]
MSTKLHTDVEKIRAEIARVRDELEWLESARIPRDELKARATERIRAAAERFDGDLALHQMAYPQGSRAELLTVAVPASQGTVKNVELAPLLSWLMGVDTLIGLVHGRIDAMDYRPGPPLAERPARLAELRTELRALEEREEATIVRAEADGVLIPRRIDADPEAVLGYKPNGEMAEGIKFGSAPLGPQGAINAEQPTAAVTAPAAPAYARHAAPQSMGPAASARAPLNVASRFRR